MEGGRPVTNEKYVVPVSERVPRAVKIGYAVGDFGANFFFQSVSI